jgi:hypothetical protein
MLRPGGSAVFVKTALADSLVDNPQPAAIGFVRIEAQHVRRDENRLGTDRHPGEIRVMGKDVERIVRMSDVGHRVDRRVIPRPVRIAVVRYGHHDPRRRHCVGGPLQGHHHETLSELIVQHSRVVDVRTGVHRGRQRTQRLEEIHQTGVAVAHPSFREPLDRTVRDVDHVRRADRTARIRWRGIEAPGVVDAVAAVQTLDG